MNEVEIRKKDMVDVMSQNDDSLGKGEDFEDGELPEDGEICDDEEEAPSKIAAQPSVSNEKERESRSDRDARETDRERERHRDRSRERGERDRERDKDPRERDRDRDRSRRFEEQPTRDLDPFGPSSDDAAQSEFFADKDYRANTEEDSFNDFDYRVNRRRRHSPTADDADYDSRNKRPYYGRGGYRGGGAAGGGGFGRARPRFNTEHQICKFFREGYCRDGDSCAYSHSAEDSLRRPILCNYYANSFCKKGLQCLMLHGEFPCIDFHKGQCPNEQCRFSHVPLTDYTRPLLETKEKEGRNSRYDPQANYRPTPGAMLPPSGVGGLPPRRRVLLPGGPAQTSTSPPHGAPIIHAPVPQQGPMNGQLPPPSVVVPTIQRTPANYQPVGYFNQGAPPIQQNLPPPRNIEPPRPVSQTQPVQEKPAPPAFNLEAMLNKLAKGGALDSPEDDSPASPPPANQVTPFSAALSNSMMKLIPDTRPITWKLLEIERKPAYSSVENAEQLPTNDPRRTRALSEQFDAFSSLLGGGNGTSTTETSYSGVDPRLQNNMSNPYDLGYQEPKRTPTIAPISSWMPQMS